MKITRNLFARHPVKRSTRRTANFAKQKLLRCRGQLQTSTDTLKESIKKGMLIIATFKYQRNPNNISLLMLGDMTLCQQNID